MDGHERFEGKEEASGDKNQYNLFFMKQGFEYFLHNNFFFKPVNNIFCKYCLTRLLLFHTFLEAENFMMRSILYEECMVKKLE